MHIYKKEYCYVEFCKNKYRSNTVFALKDIKQEWFEDQVDCFVSAFTFNEEFKKYVDTTKSVANFGGKCFANDIYLDFDSESDIQRAKDHLETFIKWGLGAFLDFDDLSKLKISFSGSKGFTLAIPIGFLGEIHPSVDFNQKVKQFVLSLKDHAESESNVILDSIDEKVYDKPRVMRLNNSINSKSALHKIRLTYDEFLNLSMDQIKELAKYKKVIAPICDIKPCEALHELFESYKLETKPKDDAHEKKQDILFDPANQGKRNNNAFRIAEKLHYHNLPENYIRQIVSMWNDNLPEPLPEKELQSVFKSASKYQIKEEKEELTREDFFNFEDRQLAYLDYIKNLSAKKINLGFPKVDAKIRGIRPGNVITLLAQTGIGKSAICQNITKNFLNDNDKICLFFSIEMDEVEVFERELQLEHSMTGYDVEMAYTEPNTDDIVTRNRLLTDKNNNFIIVVNPIEIDEIQLYMAKCRELFQKEIALVAIDYLGLIANTTFSRDEYARTTDNIRKIKTLAKSSKIPMIVISQVSRTETNKNRITLFGGKSSGDIENSSNVVLSLDKIDLRYVNDREYQKDFNFTEHCITEQLLQQLYNDYKELLLLTILKNRRGGKAESLILYDRATLQMSEFDAFKYNEVNPTD